MNKIIEKIFTILLIVLIFLLLLSEFYIVQISSDLSLIFSYLTIVLVVFTSTKEFILNKSGFVKFVNFSVFLGILVGGVFSIINKQLNLLIYLCFIISIGFSIVDLIFKK